MNLVCLDLEGVLVPEIWVSFAEASGIGELKLTTRDIADYDALMKRRIAILREHAVTLSDIRRVAGAIRPLAGAKAFLDTLRARMQVVILSDTFSEFAAPLMGKLGWPTLFSNALVVDSSDMIQDYILRQRDGKRRAVQAFHSIGFDVIAAGDSYNDLSMLSEAKRGILFRAPEAIAREFPQFPLVTTYEALVEEIDRQVQPASR